MTQDEIECTECNSTIKNDRWSKIHAHDKGWYFMRDGKAFCPDHRPPYAPPFTAK